MKLFDKAALKLTAIYTGVLLLISICFSIVVALTAANEMGRPFERPPKIVVETQSGDVNVDVIERVLRERTRQTNGQIALALVLTNLGVAVLGGLGAYFLARLTLKPIERAMESQARFVSDASHELKTPLAAIQMENEVTLREKNLGPAKLRAQIASNLEEVGKLRALTDYLLKLSQDETIEIGDVNVAAVIDDALKRTKKSAAAKNIELTFAKDDHTEIIWRVNAEALCEILTIVLDNAVKYSPPKSTVQIVADNAQIAIIDQGPGIAAADLPHIFDRFYRAEKSRTTDGYGLGLSLAQNLAEKIGLKILAENNKTGGATFRVNYN
jgi:signal transduction histidine kinase